MRTTIIVGLAAAAIGIGVGSNLPQDVDSAPISIITFQVWSRFIIFSVSNAALGPILSVQKVLLINVFWEDSIIIDLPIIEVIAYPLPRALPKIAISGFIP